MHQPIDAVIFHALPGLGGKGTAVAISPEGAIDRGRVVQILVPSGLGRGLWLDGRMGIEECDLASESLRPSARPLNQLADHRAI